MEIEVLRPSQEKEKQKFKQFFFKGLNQCLLMLRIEYIQLKKGNFSSFFVVSLLNNKKGDYTFWPNTFITLNELLSFLDEFLKPYRVCLDFLQEIGYDNSIYTLSTKAATGPRCGKALSAGHK